MAGQVTNRRFIKHCRATGRSWNDAQRDVQTFIDSVKDASVGIPSGFLGSSPLPVLVGETATPGLVTDGWMSAGAQIVTAAPTVVAALAGASSLGASTTPAREDHAHARSVEISYDGVAVGIRRRINFTSTGTVPTDDAGNNEIDVPIASPGMIEDSLAFAFLGL
jgi:hypothetical protein